MKPYMSAVLCGGLALLAWGAARPARAADAAASPSGVASPSAAAASSPSADLPSDTQALLRRLPEGVRIVLAIDLGDDNPSMRFARPAEPQGPVEQRDRETLDAMRADIKEGFTRVLGLFGLDPRTDGWITDSLGPRFVLGVVPGGQNDHPNVVLLAGVRNRDAAERHLSRTIGALARNATETTEPAGDARIHTWSGFPAMPQLRVSYLVGNDVAAISSDAGLLGAAAAARDSAPAWMASLVGTAPRGVYDFYVSPRFPELFGAGAKGAPNFGEMGIAGMTGAMTLSEDGVTFTKTLLFGKEGPLAAALAGGAAVPALTDDAFRRIPAGSLAAVAVSAPSQWLKALGGVGLLAPLTAGGPNSQGAQMLNLITSIFDGDVTVGLRTLLPLPSGVITVAGADEAAAARKLTTINDLAHQMNLPVSAISGPNGERITSLNVGQGPYPGLLLAQKGSYLVASTDRRTLEEVDAAGGTGGSSLLDSDTFRAVRRHIGGAPRLMIYGDMSALSGLGMIGAHAMFFGQPIGRLLAREFAGMQGVGTGVELGQDRIVSHTFLMAAPGSAVPALISMSALPIAAGLVIPSFAKARESAQRSACLSNMKQLALAALLYSQDWDDRFPAASSWRKQLAPYVKSQEVFHCPSDTGSGTSYAMNRRLSGLRLKDVPDPATTVLFYESNAHGDSPSGLGQDLPYRHQGGNAVAYVDGHVKLVFGPIPASAFGPQRPAPARAKPARPTAARPPVRRPVRRVSPRR